MGSTFKFAGEEGARVLMITQVLPAFSTVGFRDLRRGLHRFLRRRYFRLLAILQGTKATVALSSLPDQILAGYTYKLHTTVRNACRSVWNRSDRSDPRFCVAPLTRGPDGGWMEGHHTVLPVDFGSGESREIDILFRAPDTPGIQPLRIDIVREQCYWMSDIGSPAMETSIHVDPVEPDVEIIDPPRAVVAGCVYRLQTRVHNRSGSVWNMGAEPPMVLGAVLSDGGSLVLEDIHTVIPRDLAPLASCEVGVIFEAPREAGNFKIDIDLIRRSTDWSPEVRSRALTIPLHVECHSDQLLVDRMPAVDFTMDLTNKCPLKCIQCRKTYFETPEEQQDLDASLFRKIVAEIAPHARFVMISSAGEPLMAPHFIERIEELRRAGVERIGFTTSGMHLNPYRAERIVDLGVERIEFSLDGATAETYNKIRIGSNFEKVVRNIRYLKEVMDRRASRDPTIRFNYVLMRRNIHELPAFVELAASLGAEEVQCQHVVVFVEKIASEALVYDKERSNRFITLARDRAAALGIRFYHPPLFTIDGAPPRESASTEPVPDGRLWKQENALSFERKTHPLITDGLQICTDPWRKFNIDWQGLVFPCCMWKEEPLGDLSKSSFQEIWSSQRYRELRRRLITGELGKSCAECSAITGGDINSERSFFF